jgi:hypothetical protein
MIKTFMNQMFTFSSTVNVEMVIRVVVLLALIFATLANPGSVLAEPVMGGSVGR